MNILFQERGFVWQASSPALKHTNHSIPDSNDPIMEYEAIMAAGPDNLDILGT